MHLAESMWWIFISQIAAIFIVCVFLLNASVQDVLQARRTGSQ